MKYAVVVAVVCVMAISVWLVVRKRKELGQNSDQPKGRKKKYDSLIEAIAAGDEKAVRKLLSKGADVHETSGFSCRPALSVAVGWGHVAIVKLLLEKGANPEMSDSVLRGSGGTVAGGECALHEAAKKGNREVVEILLAAGADPSHKTAKGEKAVDLTEDEEVRALLRDAEAPKIDSEEKARRDSLHGLQEKLHQALNDLPPSEEQTLRGKIQEIADTWGVGSMSIIDGDLATVEKSLLSCCEQDMEGKNVFSSVRTDTDGWGRDIHNVFVQCGRGMHHVGRYGEDSYLAVLHARF